MKRKIILILIFVLVLAGGTSVFAQSSQDIVFDGNAQNFVTSVNENDKGFSDMEPGESRTVELTLKNSDQQEIKFFMNSEILDNIAAKTQDKQAVYDFSIAADGQIFFQAVIGGGMTENISIGQEYMTTDNNILLKVLQPNETSTITLTLKLDGDSAGNTYQGQSGVIGLNFRAETIEAEPETIYQTITQYLYSPNTGITNTKAMQYAIALFVFIGLGASLVLVKRLKRGGQ